MKSLSLFLAVLFAFHLSAKTLWASENLSANGHCRILKILPDDVQSEMICSYPYLLTKFNEMHNLKQSLPISGETIIRFQKYLQRLGNCENQRFCVENALTEMHAHVIQREAEMRRQVAEIKLQRQKECPQKRYEELRAACFIITSSEYECNRHLSEEISDVAGRSTTSAAICNAAAQALHAGEVELVGMLFALGSGIADDVADDHFSEGSVSSAFAGALFKLGSLALIGTALSQCIEQVDINCGRF